jgi:hypothetical protein
MFGTYTRNFIIAAPLTLLVPVAFWLSGTQLGFLFAWQPFVLGAVGWLVALVLRVPFIALFRRTGIEEGRRTILTILLSGPAEEGVRVFMILYLLGTAQNAFALGLGWASIEVLYGLIQSWMLHTLSQRTDEKALRARALLESQGMGRSLEPSAPLWGILERVSATAGHIGFTLLLAFNPWLVLLTAPIHSAANLAIVRLVRRSFLVAELIAAVVFFAIFLSGAFFSYTGPADTALLNTLKHCNAYPNDSTQQVANTSRLTIFLPRSLFPNQGGSLSFSTMSGTAMAGWVSNAGPMGEAQGATPDCFAYYYEFDGEGVVTLTATSSLPDVPTYTVHFDVK